MKAAVMEGVRQPLVVREVQDPQCSAHGIIVRVEANGICRSDWHYWNGDWSWIGVAPRLPHVLGHEFCGVIEEAGPEVRGLKPGQRVVVAFSQGEGTCEQCRSGHSNVCNTPLVPGMTYWGGFARYVAVPYADVNVVRLPEAIGFVEAASMGCRFMTAFHGIVDRAQVKPGQWVAVYGCGGLGLSAVHVAAATGANVIGVDLDPAKLEMAKKLGAIHVVNAKETEPTKAVRQLSGGGAHVAVDALGIAQTCRNAALSLRRRGRMLQLGLTSQSEKGEIALPIDRLVLMEQSVIGSVGMPAADYPQLLRLVESRRLVPGSLVTATVPLEKSSEVLEQMTSFANLGVTVIDRY